MVTYNRWRAGERLKKVCDASPSFIHPAAEILTLSRWLSSISTELRKDICHCRYYYVSRSLLLKVLCKKVIYNANKILGISVM